jgi:hypothetical protein
MSETMSLRKELHTFIDMIPERNLYALKPLLTVLVDEPIVIETDLTDEEHKLIEEGVQRFYADPSSFVPLENIMSE